MKTPSPEEMLDLLKPYYPDPGVQLLDQLQLYLALILRWNARMNLTSIREPREIVERHFGESLFVAQHLPRETQSLLDLGSGAGFPGIPVQLARPGLRVTLAESQHKKASFLREVIRELGLSAEVWPKRAEELAADRRFDVVALRAVDNPELALKLAHKLVMGSGWVAHLRVLDGVRGLHLSSGDKAESFIPLPGPSLFHVEHSR